MSFLRFSHAGDVQGRKFERDQGLPRSSRLLTGFGVLFLVAGGLVFMRRSVVRNKVTTSIACIMVTIFTSVSLDLQVLALDKIQGEGGIWDRDEYFPDGWY